MDQTTTDLTSHRAQTDMDNNKAKGEKYLAPEPLDTLQLGKWDLPHERSLAMGHSLKGDIDVSCARFNSYAELLGRGAKNEIPFQQANVVQQTVADIKRIMHEAELALREKLGELEKEVERFSADVGRHCEERWYWNLEDITASNDSKFVEMLNTMPITDIADFAAYLKQNLPPASLKRRYDYEYSGRTFTGKVRLLLEKVLQGSRTNYAIPLSLLMVAKAKVLLPTAPRVNLRLLEREHEYVDEMISWLVDQHHESLDDFEYWDFAACWRTLVHAWQDLPTDPGTLIRLLEVLRKKSLFEIRTRSNIAINGRLPTELADAVFEAAMLAEEIPVEND